MPGKHAPWTAFQTPPSSGGFSSSRSPFCPARVLRRTRFTFGLLEKRRRERHRRAARHGGHGRSSPPTGMGEGSGIAGRALGHLVKAAHGHRSGAPRFFWRRPPPCSPPSSPAPPSRHPRRAHPQANAPARHGPLRKGGGPHCGRRRQAACWIIGNEEASGGPRHERLHPKTRGAPAPRGHRHDPFKGLFWGRALITGSRRHHRHRLGTGLQRLGGSPAK